MNNDIDIDIETAELTSEHQNSPSVPSTVEECKNIIEAILLAANKVLTLDHILTLFGPSESISRNLVKDALSQLELDYAGRGIELKKLASGYRFQTAEETAPWVARLWDERPQRYSRALLETLALIAYRQPITRGEIEEVRGVSVSSHIMKTLLERQWVRVVGHRDVPGRPAIYATTKIFLEYFNLESLDQLPPLSEMRDIDAIAREVSEQLELSVEKDGASDANNVSIDPGQQTSTSTMVDIDSKSAGKPSFPDEASVDFNTVH